MTQSREAAVLALAARSLHDAIRREAGRVLAAPGPAAVAEYRRVERLMRIGIALAGAAGGAGAGRMPMVQVHNLPSGGTGEALPGLLSVGLVELLVAHAADDLPGALRGEPEALAALAHEARRLIEAEDIQLG